MFDDVKGCCTVCTYRIYLDIHLWLKTHHTNKQDPIYVFVDITPQVYIRELTRGEKDIKLSSYTSVAMKVLKLSFKMTLRCKDMNIMINRNPITWYSAARNLWEMYTF